MEDIKIILDESGNQLYSMPHMASELGRTEERVRQHLRSGRIKCDTSYGVKLYRISDGYAIVKGRIKKNA